MNEVTMRSFLNGTVPRVTFMTCSNNASGTRKVRLLVLDKSQKELIKNSWSKLLTQVDDNLPLSQWKEIKWS